MSPENSLMILVACLAASAVQLLFGGFVGWYLCRNQQRSKVAQPVEPAPESPAAATNIEPAAPSKIIDDQQARELLTKLHELAAGVADHVGEHNANVQSVGDELRALPVDGDSPLQALVLGAVSKMVAANERLQTKLNAASEKIQEQTKLIDARMAEARTDVLTGLANRRAFDDEMAQRQAELKQSGTPAALLMLDVDHFKKFNDKHGHQAGDEVLKGVARVMRQTLGDCGLTARYGGEEMGVVFQGAAVERLKSGAERLRVAIEAATFHFEGVDLKVTASIGVAELAQQEVPAALLKRADDALYAAKKAGRNNVHFHDGRTCLPIEKSAPLPAPAAKAEKLSASAEPVSDTLTGLATRGVFLGQLGRRIAEWRRSSNPISVALVEIDDLKTLRARHGDATGELVVKAAAKFLSAALREMDLVARYADDTFGVLLPGANASSATIVADRVRTAIAECRSLKADDGSELNFTVSTGLTEVTEGDDSESVLDRATAGLRTAILGGRNRTHARELPVQPARRG